VKALVTGGAGFIGSHLAEALIKQGDEVVVIDDFSTGSRQNLSKVSEDKKFSFVEGTILDEKLMNELIKKCEVVYHLAAAVGVKFVIDNPVRSIEINVKGTEIVLELASKFKKKVFLSSTSEVYGKTEDGLFKEDSDRVVGATTIGRWSYSCSKALDEFLCLAYYREKGLQVVIGRLFNTCGPRQTGKYGMVIPRFVKQALSNEPVTIYGDGKQTRSFCYVEDAVRAIVSLVEEPKAIGEIFNIGSEEAATIEELARKVVRLTGSNSDIIYIPYEEAYESGFEDMRHRVPDTGKIRNLIGYKPHYTLDMILEKVIEYFKQKQDTR
jgi:UDP-glucose 4-epimerase